MTLAFLLQALRRHFLVGLITLVAVGCATFAVGSLWPKTYTSNAGVLMGLELNSSKMDAQTANLYLKDRVATYAELMTSDEVVTPVADEAGMTPDQLRKRIVVTIVPDTVVLQVGVTGSSPDEAVKLTQAVTQNFSREVSSFNVSTGGPKILLAQLSSPQPADEPDQLHGAMLLAVSGVVGLVIGVLLTMVVALLQTSRANAAPTVAAATARRQVGERQQLTNGSDPAAADPGQEVAATERKRGRERRAPQAVDWDWSRQ